MQVKVTHDLGDLASDLTTIAGRAPSVMAGTVRDEARLGNALAKGFASQQHTMNSDIDVPYQESFSAERLGPLTWVYGPVDDGIPHGGSQARGYENGSRNQRPHLNLARSQDIITTRFGGAVLNDVGDLFWPGS